MSGRFVSLVLAQLNMNFGISHARYYYLTKRQRPWEPPLIAFGILSAAGAIAAAVVKAVEVVYSATAPIGQGGVALALGILASQLIVMLMGFVFVIAVFYFSNDLSVLVPLPLTPTEVLASKFAVILASEYLGLAVFAIPLLAAYGAFAGVSPVPFALSAVVVFLALPVAPLVIAAVPAVILVRAAGLSRRKDVLTMVGGFLVLALVLLFQVFMQTRMPRAMSDPEFAAKLLSTADSLVGVVGRRFPPSAWATRALTDAGTAPGLAALFAFAGSGVLGFVAFLALANRAFYRGVLGGFEAGAGARPRVDAGAAGARGYAPRSPLASIAIAEMKLLARTPVFALNGFAGFVMFPAMFMVVVFIAKAPEMARAWEAFMALPAFEAVATLVVAAYLPLMAAFSAIPFTPFSREGKRNIWILRTLPLSGRSVAFGKARAAATMAIAGSAPGIAVFEWAVRLGAAHLLVGVAVGVAACLAFCIWGALLDMKRPMLDWNDQQKAIKSNLNAILGMLVGIAFVGVVGMAARTALRAGLAGWTTIGIVAAAVGAALGATLSLAGPVADRLWQSLADDSSGSVSTRALS